MVNGENLKAKKNSKNGNGKQNGKQNGEKKSNNNSAEQVKTVNSFDTETKNNAGSDKRKPIIELVHVNKSFQVGKNLIPVLKDINVKIYEREFIIILGPSGSGKSTLLNTLLGLEYPTSGKVIIRGEDITKKSPNKLAKFRYNNFGIIFQKADWIRSLNVLQNVVLPLAINNISKKERLEKAWYRLREMGVDDHANYAPTSLSGGQQQKVCVARALTSNPPILVADEPTGNLDTESATKVMEFFKNLNERLRKTLLMVTHNIDYVTYGSRTIYIRDGKIVEGSNSFKA
ncbi:MAG: macrolide ABC transporter ATP-binding protein [Candidatus Kerfeldbacteria bacterium CG_4_10_14_0_8_um_filter_42_10]|uniref:Macrolide ABC transporter ATP-binding protein n=1 Tax=Candidatus Kerfeldbacteria bacterium CG_4_10_14_0_8_um_filter_42_10 TaxID=2014248 RepID=A0A2M7RJT8_9BACT|nr:MAG: macrolide ABC transporter ATP-binding protein [Candidatus Kerfeldbacteria bacterium CG_4_10_14_0_8_um_filter_42_10]